MSALSAPTAVKAFKKNRKVATWGDVTASTWKHRMHFFSSLKERMANKIDSAEGSVMAELEGMESKRLEAATDFAGKLEDR